MPSFTTISPVDGRILVERPLATPAEVEGVLGRAREAQAGWRSTGLSERIKACLALVDALMADAEAAATELTWQMGRPVTQTPGELRGFESRARSMIEQASAGLADIVPPEADGFRRFIRREPLGTVLVLSPWNYPYLTSVNVVIPALLAGNTVVLKHSDQTPLVAERYVAAAGRAGLPAGVLQLLHMTHADVAKVIRDPRVDFVAFTGSVEGGRAVTEAAAARFVGTGLELGGKDPAYVRADADLDFAVEQLVDGAFFNSGQSCCGIERIYVHRQHYNAFVEAFAALTRRYILGDPLAAETNLGPMVRTAAADFARGHCEAAVAAGARALIDESLFPRSERGTPYLAPQVLVDVTHDMAVMRDETFGPVVGIMQVADDAEAIARMNDSHYGLTASIWTPDLDVAAQLGEQLQTGTVFANRCDFLDPELAWVGVKDSGRGCTLSRVGYEVLTRPKSYHLRQR